MHVKSRHGIIVQLRAATSLLFLKNSTYWCVRARPMKHNLGELKVHFKKVEGLEHVTQVMIGTQLHT
jgi:hypothetical protein